MRLGFVGADETVGCPVVGVADVGRDVGADVGRDVGADVGRNVGRDVVGRDVGDAFMS